MQCRKNPLIKEKNGKLNINAKVTKNNHLSFPCLVYAQIGPLFTLVWYCVWVPYCGQTRVALIPPGRIAR